MIDRLRNSTLGQQFALGGALLCLVVGLGLVTLATVSSRHMLEQQQDAHGHALAHQIARRISTALETGDLLGISASLQRFVDTSAADAVAIFDVEGKELGRAGDAPGLRNRQYRAPVKIEADVAGEVLIIQGTDELRASLLNFAMSLVGLAVLLSLAMYGLGMHIGQRLGRRLTRYARAVALEESTPATVPANEMALLQQRLQALPMDLLRARADANPRDENYRTTAVLYLHLTSLANYVDTLDEQSLHRYTDRLHQLIYAAAGFYGGELQVVRQFGLAIYFSGPNSAGSAAFRAASCAQLVQAVSQEVEKQISLSLSIAMAVSTSELGVGDGSDIYPGLYMQHTLDELENVCASLPPQVLLSPATAADTDVEGRLQLQATEVRNYLLIEAFAGPYQDLLDRQLHLVMRRLADPTPLRVH